MIDPILYNALLQVEQGAWSELTAGRRVYPQSHCCISGNTVGVYKDPVVILVVSLVELCEFVPLTADIRLSFSASSTLVTWSIDWGDGNISNGAWPPAGPVAHPAGGYSFAGVYTIIASATDLLGAIDYDAVDVNVLYCPIPIPVLPGAIIGGRDWGVAYADDMLLASPTYYDMQSAQLTVPGSKRPRCLRFVQNDANDKWYVFMGTDCGVYRYQYFDPDNPGTGNWTQVVTVADLATGGGHAIADLHVWEIDDCIDVPGTMYACFGAQYPSFPVNWSATGIAYSTDYFQTLTRVVYVYQVVPPAGWAYDWQSEVAVVQGTGGATAYVHTPWGGRTYKTTNNGANWTLVNGPTGGSDEHVVHTPYIGQADKGKRVYALANNNNDKDYSTDSGSSWSTMGVLATRPSRATSSPWVADTLEYIGRYNWCRWVNGVHTVLNALPTNIWGRDLVVVTRDGNDMNKVILVGDGIGAGWIHLWDPTQIGPALTPAQGNRMGNWNVLTGGVDCLSIAKLNYGWPKS